MTGRVIYSSGGNYKVLLKGKVYNAKPMGIFRKDNIKILVGDFVKLEINENKKGLEEINTITELKERKNDFIRPNVSNVDNVLILTSIKEPDLNDYYLDKLITIFNSKNIKPILIFTKYDLLNKSEKLKFHDVKNDYLDMGFEVIVSQKENELDTLEKIRNLIQNTFSVVTGQTGVGKSTLLNNLNPKFNLKTNSISKSLGRGKHTTRHSEAYEIFDNTYIVDTPGFSSLEITNMTSNEISWNFGDFYKKHGNCKYSDCLHNSEEGCKIKESNYSDRTMNNYKKLQKEINKINYG